MNTYHSKVARPEEILKVLARTPSGRLLLEGFMPLLTRKKVRMSGYPDVLVRQLRAALPEGQPIGAAFIHDGVTGTIHFDPGAPLGVLAPFIAHEISHALNPKVWSGATRRSSKANVAAEMKAFEDQFRFTEELKVRDPAFAGFLSAYLPQARILHQKMTLTDVEELYGDPKKAA